MHLAVKVHPRASRNSVEIDGHRVVVRVTAPPEGGKANDAVVALVAERLGIAKSRVRVAKGHRSRNKRLCLEGMSAEEAIARLSS